MRGSMDDKKDIKYNLNNPVRIEIGDVSGIRAVDGIKINHILRGVVSISSNVVTIETAPRYRTKNSGKLKIILSVDSSKETEKKKNPSKDEIKGGDPTIYFIKQVISKDVGYILPVKPITDQIRGKGDNTFSVKTPNGKVYVTTYKGFIYIRSRKLKSVYVHTPTPILTLGQLLKICGMVQQITLK